MTAYQSVIFDLDGTLVNSLNDLAASTNYALKTLGFPTFETEEYKYFVGCGVARLIEAVLPEESRDDATRQKARALFDEYYGEHALDHTGPYPGISGMLGDLTALGVNLAVVSNKPHLFVTELVTRLFGRQMFRSILGQRDGVPIKPDPAGPFEACSIMGCEPSGCVYLGDSGVDMETAVAAGMLPVGALWGFRKADELLKSGAKKLIHDPCELIEIVKSGR